MSGSQACRNSPHEPIEKEMCHLKAEKNKLSHSYRARYVFSFYSITPLCPYYVCSNPIMIMLFSVDGHRLAFFIGQNIIIVSFAIRNRAALRTLMQIYLAIYMALHIFFSLASLARD